MQRIYQINAYETLLFEGYAPEMLKFMQEMDLDDCILIENADKKTLFRNKVRDYLSGYGFDELKNKFMLEMKKGEESKFVTYGRSEVEIMDKVQTFGDLALNTQFRMTNLEMKTTPCKVSFSEWIRR